MHPLPRPSAIEHTAEHLRAALRQGRWGGQIPGVVALCADWRVGKTTMRAALRILEAEGSIALRSRNGRSRRVTTAALSARRPLRIGLFVCDPLAEENVQIRLFLADTEHALESAGFHPFLSSVAQSALGHDVRRIRRYVAATPADAWVVFSGTREVLEWFGSQPVPCFAFAGRHTGVPIPAVAPDKAPAYAEAVRCLLGHSHHRIVLLTCKMRRLPEPGRIERAFLAELTAHGLPSGKFNLPDWEETPEGYHHLLKEIFRVTPPTALIIDETRFYIAALQFFAQRRIAIPEQVSLVVCDTDPSFAWCRPSVAQIRCDYQIAVRRIVRWAASVSKRRPDLRQGRFPAEFVNGRTIGPARKG